MRRARPGAVGRARQVTTNTNNLKNRLSSLALAASAVALTMPGGPQEEAAMHREFARTRVGRTEWFEATPELEAFITSRIPA